MSRARYIMVGGFLGAGKTTAILQFARSLSQAGLRVGLITNDQSFGLVDTAMLGSHGFPVEEITGGCFCCRFNSLVEASERLSKGARPDVFVAEPVGSCTDLRASVSLPLRKIYGQDFEVAPLSVLVDPVRALRVLGVDEGKPFSPKVLYVYRKQLEEAEIIVVNKCDLLPAARLDALCGALRREFPAAELFTVSARQGTGLEAWFRRVLTAAPRALPVPDVDYDEYAEGEALLGWLNATVRVSANEPFDGNAYLFDLARTIRQELPGVEIAHLKMTLVPEEEGGDIGVVNLSRTDGIPELSHTLKEPLEGGALLLNLRAEADPEVLHEGALRALAACGSDIRALVEHSEHFRPARPVPTYRMTGA
jgi:Ni2+-binding GTPase involved in maturation of urease and hydrogenase